MAADWHGDPDRVKVLLDTNVLMMPVQFGIDVFEEIRRLVGAFEPLVPAEVLGELQGLGRGHGRDSAAARFALTMAGSCTIIPGGSLGITVDERIASIAADTGCLVATNDRALRDLLRGRGIGVIFMRKQKTMEIVRG